jgi:hypothetical protein
VSVTLSVLSSKDILCAEEMPLEMFKNETFVFVGALCSSFYWHS